MSMDTGLVSLNVRLGKIQQVKRGVLEGYLDMVFQSRLVLIRPSIDIANEVKTFFIRLLE